MSLRFKLFVLIALASPHFSLAQETGVKKFSLEIGPEYRNENFRWSIAGNEQGTNPNILSELIFNPIKAKGFYSRAGYRFTEAFSVNAHYNRLFTFRGEVTDFDYDGDNRTDPSTELYLQSRKGHMRSAGAAVNYHFFEQDDLLFTASGGYDFTRELFYLTNDNDPSLQSTYEANWKGPNLSLKALWQPGAFNAGFGLTGRYLFYNAKANWNLVETFQHPVSFTHAAQGRGFDYRLSIGYRATSFMNIAVHGLYSDWKTKTGLDKLYQTDGQVLRARLNGAIKKNTGVRLTTTILF